MKSLLILSFLWKCYNLRWLPPGVCELCSLLAIFIFMYLYKCVFNALYSDECPIQLNTIIRREFSCTLDKDIWDFTLGKEILSYSPGADFYTGLSFWPGTTYLPEKVWLQKCNHGVFCNTPRYVVQLHLGSSFAVWRHLWPYPTLNEA